MPAPRKHVTGEKAPRPLVINDGSGENGAGPQAPPAAQQPPVEPEQTAPTQEPQAAAPQPQAPPQAPDAGPYMVELATVEALIAERADAQARRAAMAQLLCMALAAGAFLLAAAAYKRALIAESEAMLEGED